MNCCDNCANHGKTERLEWCSCVDLPRNNGVGCLSWKGKTNYDRIISKSPEELAEFEFQDGDCPPERMFPDSCPDCDRVTPRVCYDCWLDWLKQEVSE